MSDLADSCCGTGVGNVGGGPAECPRCGRPGRDVPRITVKTMLKPHALKRLSAPSHRFCRTPDCPVVYYGRGEALERDELAVPVFQKEPPGQRTVCYCLGITERDIEEQILRDGRSSAADEVTTLVAADRCVCEAKNPQGTCCLGNVVETTRRLEAEREDARSLPTGD